MRRPASQRHQQQRGQSTVEFLLMMPLILATFFFIIEMSLYFTTVHYTSYATYAAARAHAVGEDPTEVTRMLLTGSVYNYRGNHSNPGQNYTVNLMQGDSNSSNARSASGVSVQLNTWTPQLPFLAGIIPSSGGGLRFQTRTYLGPPECTYEEVGRPQYYDNNVAKCCWKMNGTTTCVP